MVKADLCMSFAMLYGMCSSFRYKYLATVILKYLFALNQIFGVFWLGLRL